MDNRIGLEMIRVTKDAHKHILGGYVLIDADADDESWKGNAVRDLLEQWPGTAESGRREPDAAPAVDDEREAEVQGTDEHTRDQGRLPVVLGPAHLRNDREIHGRAAAADEDVGGGRDAGGKAGVCNGLPSEIKITGGRGCRRTILLRDSNDEDEHGDEEGEEAEPRQPSQPGECSD